MSRCATQRLFVTVAVAIVILVLSVCLPMGKRKADDTKQSELPTEGRKQLRAQLCANSTASKSSLALTLCTLQEHGLLNDVILGKHVRCERRALAEAVAEHAKSDTPYGKVMQRMDIGGGVMWDYIHPFALIYYLTALSEQFAEFFNGVVNRGRGKLQLLLYGDEFVPGNPNRVDKGRELMSYYYTFLDLPTWMLNKCDG